MKSTSEPTVTMDDLGVGQASRVRGVSADCPGNVSRRLRDLGLLPGTSVEMVRRAPLGSPTVFAVRGYLLCLRSDQSRFVLVDGPVGP